MRKETLGEERRWVGNKDQLPTITPKWRRLGRQKTLIWQVHTQTGLQGLPFSQVMVRKGQPFPNISTDHPPEVVVSIPAARKYSSRGWGEEVGISPNSTLYAFLNKGSWMNLLYLTPPVQSHLSPSDVTNCVWEILERDLFALSMKKASTGQDSLNHITNAFSSP